MFLKQRVGGSGRDLSPACFRNSAGEAIGRGTPIVQRETFEGEIFRDFRGFVAIREIGGGGGAWRLLQPRASNPQKFPPGLESFPLYGISQT